MSNLEPEYKINHESAKEAAKYLIENDRGEDNRLRLLSRAYLNMEAQRDEAQDRIKIIEVARDRFAKQCAGLMEAIDFRDSKLDQLSELLVTERNRAKVLTEALEEVLDHTCGEENDPDTVWKFGYSSAKKIRDILNRNAGVPTNG